MRAVGLQRRTIDAGPQRVVRLGAHLDPPLEIGAIAQGRGAVEGVVEHVELVRELVVHEVVAASGMTRRVVGLVPREQHRTAVIVRLAEHGEHTVAHRAARGTGAHTADCIALGYTTIAPTSR